MPNVRTHTGNEAVASAGVFLERVGVTVSAGTTSTNPFAQLQTQNCPHCVWYVLLTAGPAGVTFTPQWAVGQDGNDTPNYVALTGSQNLVVGVPLLIRERLFATAISGAITCPGGGADATLTILLTASM